MFFTGRRPTIAVRLVLTLVLATELVYASALEKRDGDHNHHAGAPMKELNETDVLLWHAPTPPSYYSHDFLGEGLGQGDAAHPGLMAAHALFMSLAFFGALPAGIAMRSVKYAYHSVSVALFWLFCVLGCSTASVYRKSTGSHYEHASHGRMGYVALLLAGAFAVADLASVFRRAIHLVKSHKKITPKSVWSEVFLGREERGEEYAPLTLEPEEFESLSESKLSSFVNQSSPRHHRSRSSTDSLATLHDHHHHHHSYPTHSSKPLPKVPFLKRLTSITFAISERALIFIGFAELLSGLATYTGGCRGNYVNGCLAHLIKGGIFFLYGLLSFGRYLGAFANLGWAWNVSPRTGGVTAEFVECAVIFTYGATNTWMERFGAAPGSPFTTKQIQHISIAVMFWFAGFVGMCLESRRVRVLLSSIPFTSTSPTHQVSEPASYKSSSNPLPALVIGITGIAMSAHAQTYLFQVQIHALWGYLLSTFSLLRFLTYIALYLSPPTSLLPSRPPTEALASFFLAAGGIAFMFSTEEVTFAAMRQGKDDVMMFLNLTVAITLLAFVWVLSVVAFKAFLVRSTRGPFNTVPSA